MDICMYLCVHVHNNTIVHIGCMYVCMYNVPIVCMYSMHEDNKYSMF